MIAAARTADPAARRRTLELAVLIAILVLAALARLPGIDARGQWDADQGTDMLVLRALVEDGELPLLGPMTSIGSFHHGAVYYWMLAPAAYLSDADPVAVTVEIALLGIGAVAAVWWLARLVGGPLAAAVAGLLAAISPAGIDESTFIWNPNPIPLFAALAFVGVVLARRSGKARWWLLAGAGAMGTMQLHILGAVILVPLAWAWVAELVARGRAGDTAGRRAALRGGLGGHRDHRGGLPAVPRLRAQVRLRGDARDPRLPRRWRPRGGGRGARPHLHGRPAVDHVAVRGRHHGPPARLARRRPDRRRPVRDRGAPATRRHTRGHRVRPLAARRVRACVVLLALFAPSLATVTPGLPNDHYHNLLDPIVIVLTAVGLARIAQTVAVRRATAGRAGVLYAVTGVLAAVLVIVGITAWPPAVSEDGGWPLADQAAARVLGTTGAEPMTLDGIPEFKNANAMRFPIERRGVTPFNERDYEGADYLVIVCDPLFDEVVGAPCGGPAEDAWVATTPGLSGLTLADRFEAGSRRWLSVYAFAP